VQGRHDSGGIGGAAMNNSYFRANNQKQLMGGSPNDTDSEYKYINQRLNN